MPLPLRIVLPLVAVLLALAPVAQAFAPPPFAGYVTDPGHHVDEGTRAALDAHLRSIYATTGRQIAFLILDSLDGESIEDVAYQTAKTWRIGREGKDDGVVVVFALRDRKIRMEVGKGIEDRLPDLKCADIIRTVFAPSLRDGDIDGAIREGSRAIEEALGSDHPAPVTSDPDPMTFVWITVIGTALFAGLLLYGRWKRNHWGNNVPGSSGWSTDSSFSSSDSSSWSNDGSSSSSDGSSSGGGGDFGGGGASGDF